MEEKQTSTLPVDESVTATAPTTDAVNTDVATDEAAAKTDDVPAAAGDGNKLHIAIRALKAIEADIANVIRLFESGSEGSADALSALGSVAGGHRRHDDLLGAVTNNVEGRVTEGVFDGQNMVGADGKIYTVPPNYASKSKLVEGDLLKLTITPKGSFIYKQIGPIERSRVIAVLGFDVTNNEYYAVTDNRRWSILKASVTYYKGEPSDEVVLLVPKSAPSKWAAVENVIKRNPLA